MGEHKVDKEKVDDGGQEEVKGGNDEASRAPSIGQVFALQF